MKQNHQLNLATDLDGTFLEGDAQFRWSIYSELLKRKGQVVLIYVTGRGVDAVRELCAAGHLPVPDYILADHGTQLINGMNCEMLTDLQELIAKLWNNGNNHLKELLKHEPGIILQPITPPYRVAYYYEPILLQQETLEKITAAGYDVVLSCDMYMDILPKGVNKGTSLNKLLEYLGLSRESTIVCGDSLNDLCLFQTELKGVAVGNSEAKLISIVKDYSNVYLSNFRGIAGVMDGLEFYGKNFITNLAHLLKYPLLNDVI